MVVVKGLRKILIVLIKKKMLKTLAPNYIKLAKKNVISDLIQKGSFETMAPGRGSVLSLKHITARNGRRLLTTYCNV